MSSPDQLSFLRVDPNDSKVLLKSFAAAALIEAVILTGAGLYAHWLAHPQAKDADTANFIEAQIFQPQEAKLVEDKPVRQAKKEVALSKKVDAGHTAKTEDEKKIDEDNQTEGGQKLAPTHGPLAVFAPAPKIPVYLQDRDLHVSVVIDFYVSSLGVSTPKLIGSSGNDELDALALSTAAKWQFRPAENDHHAIDSKVRLRIVFDVK